MMKESEIRLGNLLSDKKGQIGEVYGIIQGRIGVDVINENWTYPPESIKPIPLTEEWLLKFGFEIAFGITNNFQTKGRFQTHIKDGIIWFEYGYIKVELKYVHQLQNLYFSLVGEELTIK